MSLNQIDLPALVIAGMYKNSLVETGETPPAGMSPAAGEIQAENPVAAIRSLGNNHRHVLVLVNAADAVHLPDESLQFLTNMLTACRLTLADVVVVNLNQQALTYKSLLDTFKSRSALLFDIEPAGLGLPISFPHYQLQSFAGCTFLYAPSLAVLEADKVQKSKLWVSLKRLFAI